MLGVCPPASANSLTLLHHLLGPSNGNDSSNGSDHVSDELLNGLQVDQIGFFN